MPTLTLSVGKIQYRPFTLPTGGATPPVHWTTRKPARPAWTRHANEGA